MNYAKQNLNSKKIQPTDSDGYRFQSNFSCKIAREHRCFEKQLQYFSWSSIFRLFTQAVNLLANEWSSSP